MFAHPKANVACISFIMIIVVACMVVFPVPTFAIDTYRIDPAHSSVIFRVKHLGITFVYGRFNYAAGGYAFEDKDIENAFIELNVQATSIDTGNEERDQHLRGPDFFDVQSFPYISFKSVSIKKITDVLYEVTGNLSLHGVTREITVEAIKTGARKDLGTGQRTGFQTIFMIKRSDYGMNYMLGGVADDVQLVVSVEGVLRNQDQKPGN